MRRILTAGLLAAALLVLLPGLALASFDLRLTAPLESNGDATPHTPLAIEEPSAASTTDPTPGASPTADDATVDDDTAPADEGGPSPALLLAGGLVAVAVVVGAIARYRSVTE